MGVLCGSELDERADPLEVLKVVTNPRVHLLRFHRTTNYVEKMSDIDAINEKRRPSREYRLAQAEAATDDETRTTYERLARQLEEVTPEVGVESLARRDRWVTTTGVLS